MTFDSAEFVWFFLGVLALYAVLSHRAQNILLLIASYFFYGYWDWRFLGLLFASSVVDFHLAQAIEATVDVRKRRRLVTASLALNLGFLGFFKYFGFFVSSANEALTTLGLGSLGGTLEVVLPVGISFYTFQTMSYVVDVYRGDVRACRRILDFALFVSFFPQLVAGPIERAGDLLPQLESPRTLRRQEISEGFALLLFGYYAKVVVADNFAPFVERGFHDPASKPGLVVATAVYSFAIQIYGDFLGYSSIARGLGLILGVKLMHNFRMPYFAKDPSDFWRRWHISLSTWLRDYLYIPLGGNRRGSGRTRFNLAATMLLGGLWHGAAWHFVAWGAFHGALLAIHRELVRILPPARELAWARPLKIAAYFQLTCVGWIFFRSEQIKDVPIVLRRFGEGILDLGSLGGDSLRVLLLAGVVLAPLVIVDALRERAGDMNAPWTRGPLGLRAALLVSMFVLITLSGVVEGAEFIYFQF
ncbi:MAG: MBOAT family protein [Deltaproteobacteria bacterium]|nr:MBOAT family protein [Deltaproteobacteria bacterium]